MKKIIIITGILLSLLSCKKQSPNEIPENPTVLFASGFEENVYIDSVLLEGSEDYEIIRGTDAETGYIWPLDILGAKNSGLHYIGDDNKKAVKSEIRKVLDYNGDSTRALYQEENYIGGDATQCPYEILDITDGTKDLYIKYRIKLDNISFSQPNSWRTFFEWKTKDYAKGSGFRLISFIYTDENGKPYWHWQGDKNSESPIWEIDNFDVPVPTNEWFLTEFYWHWSEGDDGRALWKINGQIIGDHYGPTTRRGKPIDFIMLMQIYGNANPKYQWIDDIEIWNGIPK